MRFLVDANLPRSAAELLVQCGHQVEFLCDIGLAAVSDDLVAARARDTLATLLTRDLDFADVRQYPPGDYFGYECPRLLRRLLRPRPPTAAPSNHIMVGKGTGAGSGFNAIAATSELPSTES